MFRKAKVIVSTVTAFLIAVLNQVPAYAQNFTIDTKSGADLGTKIRELVETVGMPVGGAILFLSVCIFAIKLMLSAGASQKKAEVIEGFVPLAIGGIILGGALFFAGVILGIGEKIFK